MRRLTGSLLSLLLKAPSFLVSRLPVGARDAIGDFLGLLWFDVLRVRRSVAIENLKIAFPELSESDRVRMARLSLRHMGRTLVDFTIFPFYGPGKVDDHFVVEGVENFKRALEGGKGALLLTLHLGNGDFAAATLSSLGLPIHLISKEFRSKWLNDLWFGMRRRHGTRFISPEKSSFEILRALRRNEIVIFVLDQFMGPPIGVRTKFFGRETGTAMGLALMAERTGAPVLPGYSYRRPDGKQVVVIEPPMASSLDVGLGQDSKPKNIAVMTQLYTDKVEEMIRRHPEQWMWIHRRWKEFRE